MAISSELDQFTQALLAALRSMRRANEVPTYLSAKDREVNAGYIEGVLDELLKGPALKELLKCSAKFKICSDETVRTKDDLIREINDVKPFIDRIKSGGFKLMLERYLAAHELAVKLSEVLDEVLAQNKAAVPAARK